MEKTRYLELAERLEGFRTKLRVGEKTLDVGERQQILRLLVKEILVDANSLTIRHSIPIPPIGSGSNNAQSPNSTLSGRSQKTHYLLRSRSNHCSLRRTYLRLRPLTSFGNSSLQPFLDQAKYPAIVHTMLNKLHCPFVVHVVKGNHDTLPVTSTCPRES